MQFKTIIFDVAVCSVEESGVRENGKITAGNGLYKAKLISERVPGCLDGKCRNIYSN